MEKLRECGIICELVWSLFRPFSAFFGPTFHSLPSLCQEELFEERPVRDVKSLVQGLLLSKNRTWSRDFLSLLQQQLFICIVVMLWPTLLTQSNRSRFWWQVRLTPTSSLTFGMNFVLQSGKSNYSLPLLGSLSIIVYIMQPIGWCLALMELLFNRPLRICWSMKVRKFRILQPPRVGLLQVIVLPTLTTTRLSRVASTLHHLLIMNSGAHSSISMRLQWVQPLRLSYP